MLRGMCWVSPVTSETICGHRSCRAPPPTAIARPTGSPAASSVSRWWRTPWAAASSAARYRSPRVWERVSPATTPRADGSETGERSPAK